MQEDYELLWQKFKEIRNMGWVKSQYRSKGSSGLTFEFLLGKERESFPIPDYYGIEIKARNYYSKAKITLFSTVPDGRFVFEMKRLVENFGYPDQTVRSTNLLIGEISATEKKYIGKKYQFKLHVDHEEKCIVLQIFDRNGNLIDDNTIWSFELIKEIAERKLKNLAIVKLSSKYVEEEDIFYFKYSWMMFFQLRPWEIFIRAIEKGIITIYIQTGVYYDKKRFGQIHDHGCAFQIKEQDLQEIFTRYPFRFK